MISSAPSTTYDLAALSVGLTAVATLAYPAWFDAVFGSRETRGAALRTLAVATLLAAISQKLRQERKSFINFVVNVGSVVVDDAGELKLDTWIYGGILQNASRIRAF
ncbi:hypothetical protein KXD40_002876 [Peronospora effusa]|nr:hypothetical protein KXD40_002876 [Peronospora effusa]CAI5701673.1 unnamed protein product [Peronospora effusa]